DRRDGVGHQVLQLKRFHKESRGSHAREDYTEGAFAGRDDVKWRKHTLAWVNEAGEVKLDYRPVHNELIAEGIDPHKIEP
ncbi:hypothetical protein ACC772_39570, partial [Rhizobium ruizarguesonis]